MKECSGQVPSQRSFHYSWYEFPNYFIFGGQSKENIQFYDIFVLNVQTFKWKKLFCLDGPYNRNQLALAHGFDLRFIIGGCSVPENMLLNEIWYLDFSNLDFNQSYDIPGAKWNQLDFSKTENQLPYLKGHSATLGFQFILVDEDQIVLFGGFNKKNIPQNRVYIISLENFTCQEINVKGSPPPKRGFHQMIKIKHPYIFLHGGQETPSSMCQSKYRDSYIFDTKNLIWIKINVGGYIPIQRSNFGIAYHHDNKEIIILGNDQHQNFIQIFQETDCTQGFSNQTTGFLLFCIQFQEKITEQVSKSYINITNNIYELQDELINQEIKLKKLNMRNQHEQDVLEEYQSQQQQQMIDIQTNQQKFQDLIYPIQEDKLRFSQIILQLQKLQELEKQKQMDNFENAQIYQDLLEKQLQLTFSSQKFYEQNLQNHQQVKQIFQSNFMQAINKKKELFLEKQNAESKEFEKFQQLYKNQI